MILKSIKTMPKGMKASLAFLLASIVTKAIAYITTPIFTRMLTSVEYGKVSVFFTWLQILGIPAMFCLSYGVFNNGMVDYPQKRNEYSFSMLILSNVITLICILIFFILYPFATSVIEQPFVLIMLMFVVFLFQPAYNFWLARQRYELKYKKTLFWSITISIVSPLVAIIAIKLNTIDNVYTRIFGGEAPLVVIYIGFYYYLARKSRFKVDVSFWKAAILFNLPLIPHYLSTFLLGSLDRLMISNLIGDEETAYYTVAYSVASVATIVWTAINGSLIPFTYEKCKQRDYDAISKATNPLLILFFTVCVIVILLAPEVVAIMATDEYMTAIYVIPPVVGGVFFQVQYFIYANVVYYYKKPKYVMYSSVLATLLNFILNYIFIPKYGFIAAGFTTLVSYLFQVIFDYLAMKKIVGQSVYDMRFICFISVIVLVVALLTNLIYDYQIARYTILCVSFILVIFLRKRIIGILSLIRKNKNGY